ncbi:MAG: hypothetical protein FJ220_02765 [Kiritimatiellaceae bacterium]|nr:hypothetical protein [Kiritimatiellaceae bacterium]
MCDLVTSFVMEEALRIEYRVRDIPRLFRPFRAGFALTAFHGDAMGCYSALCGAGWCPNYSVE